MVSYLCFCLNNQKMKYSTIISSFNLNVDLYQSCLRVKSNIKYNFIDNSIFQLFNLINRELFQIFSSIFDFICHVRFFLLEISTIII